MNDQELNDQFYLAFDSFSILMAVCFSLFLISSNLLSISLSISRDLSTDILPFGSLESSKLFGMFFLDILDTKFIKKE